MITDEEVLQIFKQAGAYLQGHFKLTSGLHSDTYFEKFQVLQYPHYTARICKELADRFRYDNIDLVIGAATGGIIVAYEIARQLEVRANFTERENGKMALRRGFKIIKGERILLVEDVATTGGSVREVMEVIQEQEGDLVGIGLLVDRSGGKLNFGVRTESLLTIQARTYTEAECPLCKQGIPIIKRGSREIAVTSP
ncbi:MAG: orotate phosphoribosyltransferase [Firmicutes bacterium]|nr:orotate phosphoribosyltransferase [Bacillota bacterium]